MTALGTTAPGAGWAPAAGGTDVEARALAGAWSISAAVGALWLGLVFFGPRSPAAPTLVRETERPAITVRLAPTPPTPAPPAPPVVAAAAAPPAAVAPAPPARRPEPRPSEPARAAAPRAAEPAADPAGAFGGAFAAAGPTVAGGDVRRVLGGVRVNAEPGDGVAPGRATIAGSAPEPARTPGRGTLGSGAAAGTIGAVGSAGAAGVARAAVRVSAPVAVGDAAGSDGPPGGRGDVARLGTAARGREPQLRLCYVEQGLRADPTLAGSVTVAMTLAEGGRVTGAEITRRSWSGDGAAAAEACILQKMRGWELPGGGAAGRYDFSFSFTR